jgi:hypothetical protein
MKVINIALSQATSAIEYFLFPTQSLGSTQPPIQWPGREAYPPPSNYYIREEGDEPEEDVQETASYWTLRG